MAQTASKKAQGSAKGVAAALPGLSQGAGDGATQLEGADGQATAPGAGAMNGAPDPSMQSVGTEDHPGAAGSDLSLTIVGLADGSAASPAVEGGAPTVVVQAVEEGAALLGGAQDDQEGFSATAGGFDNYAVMVHGFEISSMRDGFRRAGRAWTREPIFVDEEDISMAQLNLLMGEPNIRIVPARRSASKLDDAQ